MTGGAPKVDVAVPLAKRVVEGYFQFLKEVSAEDPVVQLAFWKVCKRLRWSQHISYMGHAA